jgi:hypothetical protein
MKRVSAPLGDLLNTLTLDSFVLATTDKDDGLAGQADRRLRTPSRLEERVSLVERFGQAPQQASVGIQPDHLDVLRRLAEAEG